MEKSAGDHAENRGGLVNYPFSAIAGQRRLKAALLVCAVDPTIGGVLIRGEKGTGKTSLVRGLSELLPPLQAVKGCPYHCAPEDPNTAHRECREKIVRAQTTKGAQPEEVTISVPLVELPLNTDEDRLAGALQLEETLKTGERRFQPGLLAAANRGILYIDEVNLLEDHLVDLILDAAASGVNRIEREGFSLEHPAAFIPIGTMNPEEGELRPQFLDRFGLCVSIRGEGEPETRKEIVRRRLAFEENPRGFIERWQEEQQRLRRMVAEARRLRGTVLLPEVLWDLIVTLSAGAKVQGHRADIVMAKTAIALAALNGRREVVKAEVQEAARLALPHRIAGDVDSTPESESERLEELIEGAADSAPETTGWSGDVFAAEEAVVYAESQTTADYHPSVSRGDELEELQVPGAAAAGSIVFNFLEKKSPR